MDMTQSGQQQQQQSHHSQLNAQTNMGPPPSSPNGDRTSEHHTSGGQYSDQSNGNFNQPVGAAAAAQQPKVVQTAFIHKLYNMLEDQSIQHLISWSQSNESFVMSPSTEFSKVLAQYFKHTNISSFVRQLNMYGFHKVSDVFHTGSPDSPLWEFKHGAGNFKRGDLVGLREIKRRASRHALIHRDSFSSAPKMQQLGPPPQPQGAPMEPMPDPVEARLNALEWNQQDLFNKLGRAEEAHAVATARCQTLLDGLTRCHQWNGELSSHILQLVPDPENPLHRDVYSLQHEITRAVDQLRHNYEESHDTIFSRKQSFFGNNGMPNDPAPPMSPRAGPQDESRRPSLQATSRPNSFKAPVPAHLQVSPRRYGSIGTGSGTYSPSALRPPPPPPPPPPQQPQPQHPLANATSPPSSLPRRHTSADIRQQGWNANQLPPANTQYNSSPYASGQSSTAWPSSPRAHAQHLHPSAPPPSNPHQPPGGQSDQHLRDVLASYELPRASNTSRHPSPPPPPPHETSNAPTPTYPTSFGSSYANSNDAGWQLPGPRFPFTKGIETSLPPTRRSSMASNVHSLLNPADTAEREGEEDTGEERKRKRIG
ncbi:hypothetical protein MBLNU230_g4160t1 [Neophaeotheca triangularis]